jgi:hypothetical protein
MEYILILLGVAIVGYVLFSKHKEFVKEQIKKLID